MDVFKNRFGLETTFLIRIHSKSQSRLTPAATNEFRNGEIYAFTRELGQLHPDNRHVRDKIRRQLQVLRDAGLLLHIEAGRWRLP